MTPLERWPQRPNTWMTGPLQLPWADAETDTALRSTYLAFRAAQTLYDPTQRSHRVLDQLVDDPAVGCLRIAAVERLDTTLGGDHGPSLGVLHVETSGDDPIGTLTRLVRSPGFTDARTPLGLMCTSLFGSPSANGGHRAGSSLLLVPEERHGEALATGLWQVASLNPAPPDRDDRWPPVIRLSASWRAQALRDGVGFIWCAEPSDPFLARADTLVRSVYTDVVLLAQLQRLVLTHLADDLAAVEHRAESRETLASLADRFTVFRNRFWWDDVSGHAHANDLLRATQEQQRTPALFDRIASDLTAFRAAVDSKALEEAEMAQQELAASQRRLQRLVEVVGGTYAGATLALAIQEVTADANIGETVGWTIIGAAAGLLAVSAGGAMLRWLTMRR